MRHEGQFLVLDIDQFGGIECLFPGLPDDHRDSFTHMACPVDRQQYMRPFEDPFAFRAREFQVEAGFG